MLLVLAHAPALGPSTWRWAADALAAAGHTVVVPDLRDAVATGAPAAYVHALDAADTAAGGADAVVGHSGAGPLLAALTTPARLVFVDAGLPRTDPDPFREHLRALAVDGVLPPWSTWFGPDLLPALVPDADRRAAITADEPRLPLAFAEADPPATTGPDRMDQLASRALYLLLSEPYRPDAERAARHGWPVAELSTSHLGLVTHAEDVAAAVARLLRDPGCGRS